MVADLTEPSQGGSIPQGTATLADYEDEARRALPPEIWHHIEGGAGNGTTLRENRAAFARLGFLPRALADLRGGSSEVALLGRRHAAPLLLAPLAYQKLAHPDGELASVRAAVALEAGMIVSTLASVTLEDIAVAARQAAAELRKPLPALWFQLYLQPERQDSLDLVRRAEAAGYEAIVLTIDAAIKPSGITLPPGVGPANLAGAPSLRQTTTPGGRILLGTPLADTAPRWEDLAWLRETTRLPVLLKGMILDEDARRAIEMGCDGLILSNHGGRILDGLPSPLDLVVGVRAALGPSTPLLLDSGFRTGADIAKALALGANAALIGRPVYHALAVAGLAGVAHMLHILRTELEMTMALLGCPTVGALTPERVHPIGARAS